MVQFKFKLGNVARPVKQSTGVSLVQKRRTKFSEGIDGQQKILAADIAGKPIQPSVVNGKTKRIIKWYWEDKSGVCSELKYGTQVVPIRQGKETFTTIIVKDLGQLQAAYEAVKAAVVGGEFDHDLEMVSARKARKK
jgi:hypothetical protein